MLIQINDRCARWSPATTYFNSVNTLFLLCKIFFKHVCMYDREKDSGSREGGRKRSKQTLRWGLIPGPWYSFFFKIFLIYSFMRDTHRKREREAETQAEGEAGSMQGAWHGTWSWVSRIMPWAEGSTKPLSHLGCPTFSFFSFILILIIVIF